MDDSEIQRIRQVYAQRDASSGDRYAWYQPDIIRQQAERNRVLAQLFKQTVAKDMEKIVTMDLGCGTGEFLRLLIEWGAKPQNLMGVELLEDRLQIAEQKSPTGVNWHLGQIDTLEPSKKFDLISAFTVFSSVLEPSFRIHLANSMWQRLNPGGWVMILDFRYNNPNNNQVKAVKKRELQQLWPVGGVKQYKTISLLPPLARKVAKYPLLYELLNTICPLCRSHFIYMVQKE